MAVSQLSSGLSNFASASTDASQPKYERLREYVIAQIQSGQFQAGSALPSENRLAEVLQIARSTVRQAMSALERDGLVRRVHGKGTFVHEQARGRLHRGQDLFALIVPETEFGFYPSLQKCFEEAAADLHNQVIVCNTGNQIESQGNSILQLIDMRVAGVAIVPTTAPLTPAYHVRQLQERGIPVVCCSRPVEGVQVPLLGIPFEEVGRRAGKLISSQGHRHAAYISMSHTQYVELNKRGFIQGMGPDSQVYAHHVTSTSPSPAIHEAELITVVDRMLAGPNPPTAFFVSFDSLAELVYLILGRRGLRVPEDISIVSFGGSRRTGALANQLTAVTLDELRLGREAVDLLSRMRLGELPIDLMETRDMSLGISPGRTLQAVANKTTRNSSNISRTN
ncbi:GntR family transcriptional regulator [Planctomicrobium sp. SH661]|uniref:GntR family transcriptional regulator n=1 Tax=Planctomicrobium sp. SH661 TaxID=3448124 RepID=UPI003F5C4B81